MDFLQDQLNLFLLLWPRVVRPVATGQALTPDFRIWMGTGWALLLSLPLWLLLLLAVQALD